MRRSQVGNKTFRVSSFKFEVGLIKTRSAYGSAAAGRGENSPQRIFDSKLGTMKGFTLIELIMVVFILGLAFGIAGVKLSQGLDGLYLKASAKDIVTTLRYAREKAIAEQIVYKVGFDVERNQVYLADEVETKKTIHLNEKIRLSQVKIDEVEVKARQQIGAGIYLDQVGEISFYPTGSSNKGEIILENTKGSKLRVVTDFLTGSARITNL